MYTNKYKLRLTETQLHTHPKSYYTPTVNRHITNKNFLTPYYPNMHTTLTHAPRVMHRGAFIVSGQVLDIHNQPNKSLIQLQILVVQKFL